MDKWFYKHRGRELGPVSADELRYLVSITRIVADTMIRKEGSVDWIEYRRSEVFVKPVSKSDQVTEPATVPEKRLHVDQPQESVSSEVSTQPNPDHAPSQHAFVSLTEEERRARIISAAVVCSLLIMLTLLVLLWPRFAGLSGEAGNQSVHSGDAGSSGEVKSDSQVSGDNASNDQAVSGADTDGSASAAAADSADEIETPAAPSSTTTATTESTEEMAEAEPPDASNSDAVTAGTVAEAEPENRELDEKFGISLPKKKSRTESGHPRPTPKADLQESDMTARSGEERKQALDDGGGTAESEQAVALALKWLKERQQADGSWDFREVGQDAQPGILDADLGATAMAMLCFLGAGNTTRTGPEKEVVKKTFDYIRSQKDNSNLGQESMYVHALVTLCLTELAAMEPDETDARTLAIKAIGFMESAQDPHGGGWRYRPREPGDTSVTGWQILALQSAKTAKIKVDQDVVKNANRFLDSVSDYDKGLYCYTQGSPASPCMTAVGVLCRMYLGWSHDNSHLQRGLESLVTVGVSPNDMYYNYYAAMALHHAGGPEWTTWNAKMREQLVQTQIKSGPAAGSWPVTDPHGQSAGQIYQTALAVLTLEVYYRYLPLYRNEN